MVKNDVESDLRFYKALIKNGGIIIAIGGFLLTAGVVYGRTIKDIETNTAKTIENKEQCEKTSDNINKKLEKMQSDLNEVIRFVWKGEGEKCKILSKRRKMPKKKRESQKKRNDLQQLKVYAID